MKREEHKNIVNEVMKLVTPENQATATELLTQLTDDYEKTLTNNENLTSTNATLTENNEKLRKVNADLFLKVGVTNKENKEDKKEQEETEDKKLSFDALFNEKGELI